MDIRTDGGCAPNPGRAGGAPCCGSEGTSSTSAEAPRSDTDNRMELTAPIMVPEALKRPLAVRFSTDSTYVRNGITRWVLGWERNGWITSAKQPVKNVDLWRRLGGCTRPPRDRVAPGEAAASA